MRINITVYWPITVLLTRPNFGFYRGRCAPITVLLTRPNFGFYRGRCASAVLTMAHVSVCLSLCVSVTSRCSLETAYHTLYYAVVQVSSHRSNS